MEKEEMNEIPKPQYREPFKEPLEYSEVGDVLKEFKGDPEILVKEIGNYDYEHLDVITKRYKEGRRITQEVCDKYGFAVPNVKYVIGPSSDKPKPLLDADDSLYQIKDKVHGRNLDNLLKYDLPDEEIPALRKSADELFSSLTQYLLDTFRKGGKWLYDIFPPRQWAYGKRAGETENRMYLLDVDDFEEYVLDPKTEQEKEIHDGILKELGVIAMAISYVEKCTGDEKLEKARAKVLEAMDEMLENEPIGDTLKSVIIKIFEQE